MTVTLISAIQRYVGLLSDSKPPNPVAGSTFIERDTGREYIWDGAAWGAIGRGGVAATATLANVSGSAASVTLLAANTSRLGAVIINDSSATCYLKYGSTASSTSFTYLLQPGATWEMPHGVTYTGIITGIWSSATGAARCTELS